MNPLVVIPTFITNSKRSSYSLRNIMTNYDYESGLNDTLVLDRCLKSLQCVKDLGLVCVIVSADTAISAEAVEKVKRTCANNPSIKTIVVGEVELDMLKKRAIQLGNSEIIPKIGLRGYSAVRNTGLLLTQAFGFNACVFLNDDEVVEDPDFLSKAMYGLGKLTRQGVPILVKSGFYINESGSYLSSWKDAWYNKFWQQGAVFNEWISSAIAGSRLSRSSHVCGGCLAIHKEAFSRLSFDPYIPRGEDLDYMLNLRMYGSDIWFDNKWSLRRLAPKTKSEGNRFRQDIFRWLYEQAKIEYSWSLIDLQKITAASLSPYPGILLGKGLKTRIWLTAKLRSFGRPDKKAYSLASKAAKKEALTYAYDNCTKYFDFQHLWPSLMKSIESDAVLSQAILKSAYDMPSVDITPGATSEIQSNIS